MEDGLVKVVAPIDDTPAARAGVQAGDLITHLDNEAVQGLTLQQAVEKMRGPIDTPITLRITRKGVEKPIEAELRARPRAHPRRALARGRRDQGYRLHPAVLVQPASRRTLKRAIEDLRRRSRRRS